jgi:hypothetical protein
MNQIVTPRRTAVGVLLIVVGLVSALASPAAAVSEGAGAGQGWEYPNHEQDCSTGIPPNPTLGVAFSDADIVLRHSGEYVAEDGAGATIGVFVGDTDVSILVDDHVAAPQGVSAGDCTGSAITPSAVDILDVDISGTATINGVTGTVACDMPTPNGSYVRVNDEVVFTFEVQCDITGNDPILQGSVVNENMVHVIEGTMDPCFYPGPIPPVNPECTAARLVYDPRPSDDPGSHLVTAYEALGTGV